MSAGRHRPFIYDGLHFVQEPPKPGLLHALVVTVLALVFAFLIMDAALFAAHLAGIPVKWAGTETPLIHFLGLYTASP